MKDRSNPDVRELSAYLEGEVTASERETIEAQLRDSADVRRTLSQLESLRGLLSAPATELESMDLAARVLARGRELPPLVAARPRRWQSVALAGLAASAAALCLVLAIPKKQAEFLAKSNGTQLEGARWAGMHVFHAKSGVTPERLSEKLKAGESLVFTYTNLGTPPYHYLMIFSVDAAGQIRWFYPVYESAGEDPESIPIQGGSANVALGDLVQQDFSEGPLALYALFMKERARVLEIEAWLKQRGRPPDEAPVAGDFLQRFDTRVER